MKGFGERLAYARKQRGYTQQDVSKHLQMLRGTYAHYEIDAHEPDFETLCKLADILDVSTDLLLGREMVNATSYKDVVNGKTLPDLRTAQKISRALGTTVDELWPLEDIDNES